MIETIAKFEELVNAEQAKQMTAPKIDSPDKVAQSIQFAIIGGRNFTTANLDEETIKKLQDKGYTVKKATLDPFYFIEW